MTEPRPSWRDRLSYAALGTCGGLLLGELLVDLRITLAQVDPDHLSWLAIGAVLSLVIVTTSD